MMRRKRKWGGGREKKSVVAGGRQRGRAWAVRALARGVVVPCAGGAARRRRHWQAYRAGGGAFPVRMHVHAFEKDSRRKKNFQKIQNTKPAMATVPGRGVLAGGRGRVRVCVVGAIGRIKGMIVFWPQRRTPHGGTYRWSSCWWATPRMMKH